MTVSLDEFEGEHSLTVEAGGLPADAAVAAAGHEPNGYFWEGVVEFAWPDISERLDFDCEADAFRAIGDPADLAALKAALQPVITSPDAIGDILTRAQRSGFEFDD